MLLRFTHIHQITLEYIEKQQNSRDFKMFKCRKILPNFEQPYDVIIGLNQNFVSYNTCQNMLSTISNHKNSYILKNVYTYPSTVLDFFVKKYNISRE